MKTPPADLAQRLLDASTDVLRLDGDVRLDDVAQRVGVARATLYYYFAGRDDLTTFLLSRHMQAGGTAIADAAATTGPVEDRLRSALGAMVAFLADHPGVCGALLSMLGAAGHMGDAIAANDRAVASPLRELLIEGRALGTMTFADAADAANALLGATLIAVLARAVQDRPLDAAFQHALVDQLLRSVTA